MAVLQNNSYLKRAWGPVQDISNFQAEGLEINLNKCQQGIDPGDWMLTGNNQARGLTNTCS